MTNPDSGSRDPGSRRGARDDIEKTILSSKDPGAGQLSGFDSEKTVPTGGPNAADGYSPTVTHYDPERTVKSDVVSDAAPVMPLPTRSVDFTQPQIPGYEMIEKIGEGGMGIVFKATQTSLNRVVAIKVVKAAPGVQGLEYEEFVKRFRREALAGAKLNHQNIVSIYDHGVANGVIFMALEFVDGPTAAKVVRKEGRMPVRQALAIVRDCVLGLSHAHAKGIIHRDVKPANILLQSSGAEDARGDSRMLAKIADLGLSRFGDRQTPELNNLTRAGTFLGSPDHMAPEQADGRNVDFRADIYALGSTLYYLVTGKSPFRGESEFDLVMKKTTSRAENPQDMVGGISDDFVLVLDRMMARKPEMRYGSYQELLHDLDALLIDGHPATPPVMRDQASIEERKSARPKAPTKLIETQKKKRGMIIAAAAVIVVLGGAGAYFFTRPKDGGDPNVATSSPKDKFFAEFGAAKIEDLIGGGAGWRNRFRDLLSALPESERAAVDDKYRAELNRRLSAYTTETVQRIENARNERNYVVMADSAKDVVQALQAFELEIPETVKRLNAWGATARTSGAAEKAAFDAAKAAREAEKFDEVLSALADFETKFPYSPGFESVAAWRSWAKGKKADADRTAKRDLPARMIETLKVMPTADVLGRLDAEADKFRAAVTELADLDPAAKSQLETLFTSTVAQKVGDARTETMAAVKKSHAARDYAAMKRDVDRIVALCVKWKVDVGQDLNDLLVAAGLASQILPGGATTVGEFEKTQWLEASAADTAPERVAELLEAYEARFPFAPEPTQVRDLRLKAMSQAVRITATTEPALLTIEIGGRRVASKDGQWTGWIAKKKTAFVASAPTYYDAAGVIDPDVKDPVAVRLLKRPDGTIEPKTAKKFDPVVNAPAFKKLLMAKKSLNLGLEKATESGVAEWKCNVTKSPGQWGTIDLDLPGLANGTIFSKGPGWSMRWLMRVKSGIAEVRTVPADDGTSAVLGIEGGNVYFGIRQTKTDSLIAVVDRRPAVVTDPAGAEFLTLEWHGDVLVASHGTMFESRTEIGRLDMKPPRKADQFQLAVKDGEAVFKEMFIHPSTN